MKKLLLICFLLAGCSVAKKQAREVANMQVYAVRYPAAFKELAAIEDPCFNGKAKSDTVIQIDSVIIPGKTNIIYTKGKGDTVIKTITIKLPGQIKVKTINIHDTVTNDRKIVALEAFSASISDSLKLVKNQLKKTGDQDTHRLWWLIGIAVVALIYIVIKIYALFSSGAVVKAGSGIFKLFK